FGLLPGSGFEAKLPALLQAAELVQHVRIQRVAVSAANHIQERVGGYGAVARVGNGRTDEPDRSAVAASHVLLSFGSAWEGRAVRLDVALQDVVEFVRGQDDTSSIQVKAVGITEGLVYGATLRIIGGRGHVEIGDDPHAQQIVAKITKRAVTD